MTAPRIVGIDPSLTGTAFAWTDGSCLRIDTPALVAKKGATRSRVDVNHHLWVARIGLVESYIEHNLTENNVDLVVIEGAMMASRQPPETMWMHGCIRRLLVNEGIRYIDVAGASRQKFACGNQKDRSKDAVLLAARDLAGPDVVHNNDEADAWWLRQIALAAYGHASVPETRYRAEVLASYEWPEIDGVKPRWVIEKRPKKARAA